MSSQKQPLAGRVALVTGASRGIGRATALALAGAGADVVVVARSREAAPSRLPGTIEETAGEAAALGRRALAVAADVSDEAQVRALAERVSQEFGRLDLLVNNAAYFFAAPFREIPQKRWDLVLDVNLRGAVLCARAFLPSMLAQGSGRIVNVSSSAAEVLPPGMLAYAVSKAALETLTRGLAAELEPHGIAVNALRIDRAVATEGALFVSPEGDYSDWAKTEEAARAVLWLATRPTSYSGHIATMSEALEALDRDGAA